MGIFLNFLNIINRQAPKNHVHGNGGNAGNGVFYGIVLL